MKIAESVSTPNFGMKFKLERIKPVENSIMLEKDFFNVSYQSGILARKVEQLKPEDDVFVLKLGSPEYKYDKNAQNPTLKSSYNMFVDIISAKDNSKKTFDLSEDKIELEYLLPGNRLEVHPKGPFHKMLDFVDKMIQVSD